MPEPRNATPLTRRASSESPRVRFTETRSDAADTIALTPDAKQTILRKRSLSDLTVHGVSRPKRTYLRPAGRIDRARPSRSIDSHSIEQINGNSGAIVPAMPPARLESQLRGVHSVSFSTPSEERSELRSSQINSEPPTSEDTHSSGRSSRINLSVLYGNRAESPFSSGHTSSGPSDIASGVESALSMLAIPVTDDLTSVPHLVVNAKQISNPAVGAKRSRMDFEEGSDTHDPDALSLSATELRAYVEHYIPNSEMGRSSGSRTV